MRILNFSFILLLAIITPSSSFPSPNSVYEPFLQCLKQTTNPSDNVTATVFAQNNPNYTPILRSYIRNARLNTSSTPKPQIIITPLLESHVQAAIICAKKIKIQLKIRSGGHDYEGLSYISDVPFIILDMFNLKSVDVNIKTETATVQAGAILGELLYAIWEKSKVYGFPAGICPTMGIAGHISGGGYGNMLRKYGLSSDNVIDAKIVDANGKILDRKSMGEDLFWAIRGGGGASFGVILSFTVKLVPVPEKVTVFRIEKLLNSDPNLTDFVHKWQSVAPTIDNDLFMRLLLQTATRKNESTIRVSVIGQFLGDSTRLVSIIEKELPELGLKKENCTEMGWTESVLWWDEDKTVRPPKVLLDRNPNSAKFLRRKSDYVEKPLSKTRLESLWKAMMKYERLGMVWNSYGGRMSEIATDETAMPHRAGNLYKIQYSTSWSDAGDEADKKYTNGIRKLYSFMTPFVSNNPRKSYLNYRDIDIGSSKNGSFEEGKVYGIKYFSKNFDRLVKVKTAVDPDNFFRYEQSIPVLPKSD